MAHEEFSSLLERMPEIAAAVNSFQSEEIQREAFQALVATFNATAGVGGQRPLPPSETTGQTPAPDPGGPTKPSDAPKKKSRSRRGPYTPKLVKDLDLAPAGKRSFSEFIAEKQPRSNEDKYAVIVYYLQHEAEVSAISFDHVATVFRLTPDWKEPKNVRSGVTTAASRKGTIDTADYNDLRTTPHGRNFVEHELPQTKGPK